MNGISRGWSPLPGAPAAPPALPAGPLTPSSPIPFPPYAGVCPSGYYVIYRSDSTGRLEQYLIPNSVPVSTFFNTGFNARPCPQGGGAAQPGPTQPTPPPLSAPPTETGNLYFAVCFKGPNDALQAIVVAADDPGTALNSVANATKTQGPFTSQQEALAWIGANKNWCMVGRECIIKPLFDCPAIPPQLVGLGTPGTKEWCDALDSICKALGDIGTSIYSLIDSILDTNTIVKNMDDYYNSLNTVSPARPFVGLLRAIYCAIGPVYETLRQSISCARTWMDRLFDKCNNSCLFGLLTVRHVLLTIEKIEWGSDAGVWITAVSGFYIDPFMTTLDYLIRYSCPIELMSEADVMEMWRFNYLPESTIKCLLAAHGKQLESMRPALDARGEKISPKEIIQLLRRTGGSANDELKALRNVGVTDPTFAQAIQYLYDELPTIGDHLEWMRKNVFDDAYVRDFNLMEGFEERFWVKFGDDLRALGMKKENAALHYAAHWINPSFTQLFEMTQRLRPGRVPDELVFTTKDLLRVMQEQDVGIFFRQRLEAISHPVPNLTLTIQLYEFGAIDDNNFLDMLQDLGFTRQTAQVLLQGQIIKVRRRNASTGHGWTPVALANAYAVGAITEQMVRNEMTLLGYDKLAADKLIKRAEIEFTIAPVKRMQRNIMTAALKTQENAYVCGAINRNQYTGVLQKAGISNEIAAIAADNADATTEVMICKQQIMTFRQAILKGKATADQVQVLLIQAGVPPVRAKQYLDLWVAELSLRNPSATVGTILRWVSSGLLPPETARQRLLNLGWSDPDTTLMLAEASGKLSQRQARIIASQTKSQQSAIRAAAQALKANRSEASKLRSILRGNASVRTLQKWFKEDLITLPELSEYIAERGYPPREAQKYVEEAIAIKSKPKPAKGGKKAVPPATQSGGGAGSAAP